MTRNRREHFFGALYHTILRGNNHQDIFNKIDDQLYFLDLLGKAVNKFNCKIHLFCLIRNHVHLVIQVKYVPQWKIIQSISSAYAKYMNNQYKQSGHLFERYQSKLIPYEKYLLELCYYIHRIPLNLKIIANLDDYLWSSHMGYLGIKKFDWLTTNTIMSDLQKKFGNKDNVYHHFIISDQYFDKTPFCDFDEEGYLIIKKNLDYKASTKDSIHLNSLSIVDIAKTISSFMKIDSKTVLSKCQDHNVVLARSMIAYFAHYYANHHFNEISSYLNRNPKSLSRTMHRTIILQKTKPIIYELENIFREFS